MCNKLQNTNYTATTTTTTTTKQYFTYSIIMAHKIHYTQLIIISWVFLTLEIRQQNKKSVYFCIASKLLCNEPVRKRDRSVYMVDTLMAVQCSSVILLKWDFSE